MTHKIFFNLFVYVFILSITIQADSTQDAAKITKVPTQKFLRFINTKKEFGKSCQEYYYITS